MTTTMTRPGSRPQTAHAPRAAAHVRPSSSWAPDLLCAGFILTLVAVTGLWVHGRGLQQINGVATGMTSIGRLAGLLATDLMLIQVLLMARVPWIEQVYGQDRLARWHRVVGFTSFDLMLGHIALIILGYAGTTHTGVLHEAWTLVATYPGMLLATAATGAMIMVAVTSVRAARRKLRYENWHLLHLYAYLGIGLALPHQLWTGGDFVSSAIARAYWWAAYIAVLAAVLGYRVGAPLWRTLRHKIEVVAVVPEAPGVHSVWLRGRNLHLLPARAGQFFQWRFLSGKGWTRAHPYSLSAAPRPDMLRITVKASGDGSAAVRDLRPGTRVLIEGPFGQLTAQRRTMRRLTMVASGVGITPLRALLEEMPYGRGDATLLYRARREEDLVFQDELERLAEARGIRVLYLIGRRGRDGSWLPDGWGNDARALRQLVPDVATHDVFVCGPDEWMSAVQTAARQAGVPAERLHLERFSW